MWGFLSPIQDSLSILVLHFIIFSNSYPDLILFDNTLLYLNMHVSVYEETNDCIKKFNFTRVHYYSTLFSHKEFSLTFHPLTLTFDASSYNRRRYRCILIVWTISPGNFDFLLRENVCGYFYMVRNTKNKKQKISNENSHLLFLSIFMVKITSLT